MPYIEGIKNSSDCNFCEKVLGMKGEEDLVIHRGRHAFVILNLYPYSTGHLMVVPYRHVGELADLTSEELAEATCLLGQAERAVEAEFGHGRHLVGLNIGRCAGAGVEGHLHIHLVPGDPPCGPSQCREAAAASGGGAPASDSTIEDMPEPLAVTRERLRRAWAGVMSAGPHSSNS
jgi:diadenosine tetraphosphate (Ap4A) HIT family hydrolase